MNQDLGVERDLCAHIWTSNSGLGGPPRFTLNRHMSADSLMHVMCHKCHARTWLSENQWQQLTQSGEQPK